ncbi:hypothetical protein A2738_00230 [Candidatus Nomurabacteria bacterium RIFCSPHIGHO2_01_FULL_42_15]|uniref:Uncharacterized protein n=1 Tax=Candidatus Nomurabacteria bacterium RIFCSPHIGHO2_01_FULL_42_15 TaxID=1801742 RepID=A0A1F6VGJ3_9BACT|nr:MAG: hypothetical protein A2738_00230 [Candidatus Nomurabacteria bacterium RIFCSPHIGHO2_01_FULL_42_15]OGI92889.1 MAG: hypothetical protein A3A99_02490 [Candidatus Nomurabacteria bacterium RIFCSPLOWO2_01_FULL_41_18]
METSNDIFGDTFLGSKWFNPDYLFNQGISFFTNFESVDPQIVFLYHSILFFLALFFLTVISYSTVRLFEIRSKEKKHLEHEIHEFAHHQAELLKKKKEGEAVSKNEQWVKTLSYLFSQHASDWKLAVIEADNMLDALTTQLGMKGANLGEKLKGTTTENFRSLRPAWEVHTIRNRIAHEGAFFELSQHEAKRVIALYEHIFREFGYI